MSLAELRDKVAELTPEERLQLSAFLADLEQENEVEFRAAADGRMKAMDAGRKVTMEEFEQRHEKLKSEGR